MEIAQENTTVISLKGQKITLHQAKALFWEDEKVLILSDLHLGKADHFRKNGIAVPANVLQHDLTKVAGLISQFDAEEVIFVGDLFHSGYNHAWESVIAFTRKYDRVDFHLVLGNHDIMKDDEYTRARIQVHDPVLIKPPFIFSHISIDDLHEEHYCISGHVHPAVRLKGPGMQSMRLPCFYFGEEGALLPAFGAFTGMATIIPEPVAQVYAISDVGIIDLSPATSKCSTT